MLSQERSFHLMVLHGSGNGRSPYLPCPLHVLDLVPAVFSQPSCLKVVGGRDQHDTRLSKGEIFIPHMSQWHKASPAPSPLSLMSTTVIQNKFFLAEYDSTKLYQLCVSVHQTATSSSITPKVITEWKDIADLPHKRSALGVVKECLLAVGGAGGGRYNPIITILSFSPITNTWKTVGELPEPRQYCTTVLSLHDNPHKPGYRPPTQSEINMTLSYGGSD